MEDQGWSCHLRPPREKRKLQPKMCSTWICLKKNKSKYSKGPCSYNLVENPPNQSPSMDTWVLDFDGISIHVSNKVFRGPGCCTIQALIL